MTNAKEFMEKIKGEKIVDVALIDGAEDLEAGDCQFEIVLESGYGFVA